MRGSRALATVGYFVAEAGVSLSWLHNIRYRRRKEQMGCVRVRLCVYVAMWCFCVWPGILVRRVCVHRAAAAAIERPSERGLLTHARYKKPNIVRRRKRRRTYLAGHRDQTENGCVLLSLSLSDSRRKREEEVCVRKREIDFSHFQHRQSEKEKRGGNVSGAAVVYLTLALSLSSSSSIVSSREDMSNFQRESESTTSPRHLGNSTHAWMKSGDLGERDSL